MNLNMSFGIIIDISNINRHIENCSHSNTAMIVMVYTREMPCCESLGIGYALYVCVYIYTYIYTYMCVYLCTSTYTRRHIYIYIYIYTYIHRHRCTYLHAHTHTHTHACARNLFVCIYIYICIYLHIASCLFASLVYLCNYPPFVDLYRWVYTHTHKSPQCRS